MPTPKQNDDEKIELGIEVKLQQFRVWTQSTVPVRVDPSESAPELGRLRPGAVVVAIAQVTAADGTKWHRVQHSVVGGGYVPSNAMTPAERGLVGVDGIEGSRNITYELVRRPRTTWVEPTRYPDADVTFTITFTFRIARSHSHTAERPGGTS